MMLKISARAILLIALFSFANQAASQTWEDLLMQAELFAEQGNVDSAQSAYQRALLMAENQYAQSDSTVRVVYFDGGYPHRAYFRSFEQAQQVYSRLLSGAEIIFGHNAPQTAELHHKLAKAYYREEKYEVAETIANEALVLRQQQSGRRSLKVVEVLLLQAKINYYWDRLDKSESLLVEALNMAEEVGGSDHPLVAQCLYYLADQFRYQNKCHHADSLILRAWTIVEKAYAQDAAELSRFRDVEGRIAYCLDDYRRAAKAYEAVLPVWEEQYGKVSDDVARLVTRLAHARAMDGNHAAAESLYVRALEIRRELYDPVHTEIAYSLRALAWLFYNKYNDYQTAESLYTQAAEIISQVEPLNKSDYSRYLWDVANCLHDQGKFSEALPIREKIVSIQTEIHQPGNDALAWALRNVGVVNRRLGRFDEAEKYLKEALSCMEAIYGPEHTSVASVLNDFALTYDVQCRFAEAEKLYRRSMEIDKKLFGDTSKQIAPALMNLGGLYWSLKDYDQAASSLEQAVEIFARTHGPRHYQVAISYLNLGLTYDSQERYREADSVLRLSIEIAEESMGLQHPALAHACDNLGNVYTHQGRYAEAEPVLERAVSILEHALGPEHPEVAKFCRDLGRMYVYAGKSERCLQTYRKFIDWSQRFLENVFPYSSENQRLRWIQEYPLLDHAILSLALWDKSEAACKLALEMVLKSKAVVVEAVMSERQVAYCTYDSALLEQLDRLSEVHTEIASVAMAGGELADSLQILYQVKDSIEITLSRHCSEFGDALAARRFALDDILSAIPDGSVLWEFVKYEPHDLDSSVIGQAKLGTPRYLAFLVRHNGEISASDLGDAHQIDSLITLTREIIYKAQGQIYSPAALASENRLNEVTSQLSAMLFEPLAASIGVSGDVFIAPDGMLNLLPFEILPMTDGSYAVENYRIGYLSSGRDLLKYERELEADGEVLVMADANFDGIGDMTVRQDSSLTGVSLASETYGPDMRSVGNCLNAGFSRLSHTRAEAESVSATLRAAGATRVGEYYDDNAVEEILKSVDEPPRVLHLATHGFFCESSESAPIMKNSPLLRSGLALTGANRTISGQADSTMTEDGILTALEVSGLNLVGTDLAVLSACESGVGEFVNGEGMFGLRRAFQHAGAKTIIMSLWSVPDKETSQLMEGFYRRWLNGKTKRDALRESALEILNQSREKRGCGHPLLWGGFILAGNPN
ncbi:MAG: CHAT domain-containing protein [Candidatus Zixiibacteriota bacterium]|nr:MAG: CHAT domain-containing protein [candidate division Zixibacteria bacterium]